jgi:hypothetical protein
MTKRYIHPDQLKEKEPVKVQAPDPAIIDISLDDLLGKSLLILYREIRNLLIESSGGKLDKDSSQNLRDYIKLLNELKTKEKDVLNTLSDEELEKLLQEKR